MKLSDELKKFLRTKFNECTTIYEPSFPFVEHDYGYGDTEQGFSSTYEIDWDVLDHQIDEFCKEFQK